jgi:hypothetical protein
MSTLKFHLKQKYTKKLQPFDTFWKMLKRQSVTDGRSDRKVEAKDGPPKSKVKWPEEMEQIRSRTKYHHWNQVSSFSEKTKTNTLSVDHPGLTPPAPQDDVRVTG